MKLIFKINNYMCEIVYVDFENKKFYRSEIHKDTTDEVTLFVRSFSNDIPRLTIQHKTGYLELIEYLKKCGFEEL